MLKTTVDSTVWMAAVPLSSCLMVATYGQVKKKVADRRSQRRVLPGLTW